MSQLTSAPPPSWRDRTPPPPPQPRRDWIVPLRVLCVLAAVGLIGFVVVLSVLSFFARTETAVRTFPGTIERVEVRTDVGDVSVEAGAAGESARLTTRAVVAFGEPDWSAAVTGSTLVVSATCDDAWVFGVDQCGVDIGLVVPPGVPVDVRTHTGDVTVADMTAGLTLTTDTGDVRLRGTSGGATVQTSVGDVSGSGLSGAADVHTETGDVRLRYRTPPSSVSASTQVGEILVVVPADETLYRVTTDSDVGDVRVDVPVSTESDRPLTARTDTGDIRLLGG